MQHLESRRYRVTAVLGEGGFGKVYRAQMVGAEGFVKDVAIKLLHDGVVPDEALKRFRDEARILGLVRDRAIVTVEPPTQLGGRWAVVMEFVDGASAKALLELGPFPPEVVAEVIREIARALDHVYWMKGPDGEPLHLMHRDLKPENIQISRSGEVKILDFGTAKARFENREAKTLNHIGGTLGYIAPERLEGHDGAAADIYSLGVMTHVLLTGKKPSRRDDQDPDDPTSPKAMLLDLARQMRSPEPEDRPTARDVEEATARIHRHCEGVTLRSWAEAAVNEASRLQQDGLVGHVLTETVAGVSLETSISELQPLQPRKPYLAWALVGLLLAALGAVLVAAVGAVGGLGIVVALLWPTPTVAPPGPTPPPPVLEVGSVDVPVRVETAVGEAPPVGVTRPRPAPEPVGAVYTVVLNSVPQGATIYVDGRKIGETPLFDVKLVEGVHAVRMVSDSESSTKKITVGRLKPGRWVWKGGDTWLSYSN